MNGWTATATCSYQCVCRPAPPRLRCASLTHARLLPRQGLLPRPAVLAAMRRFVSEVGDVVTVGPDGVGDLRLGPAGPAAIGPDNGILRQVCSPPCCCPDTALLSVSRSSSSARPPASTPQSTPQCCPCRFCSGCVQPCHDVTPTVWLHRRRQTH